MFLIPTLSLSHLLPFLFRTLELPSKGPHRLMTNCEEQPCLSSPWKALRLMPPLQTSRSLVFQQVRLFDCFHCLICSSYMYVCIFLRGGDSFSSVSVNVCLNGFFLYWGFSSYPFQRAPEGNGHQGCDL